MARIRKVWLTSKPQGKADILERFFRRVSERSVRRIHSHQRKHGMAARFVYRNITKRDTFGAG